MGASRLQTAAENFSDFFARQKAAYNAYANSQFNQVLNGPDGYAYAFPLGAAGAAARAAFSQEPIAAIEKVLETNPENLVMPFDPRTDINQNSINYRSAQIRAALRAALKTPGYPNPANKPPIPDPIVAAGVTTNRSDIERAQLVHAMWDIARHGFIDNHLYAGVQAATPDEKRYEDALIASVNAAITYRLEPKFNPRNPQSPIGKALASLDAERIAMETKISTALTSTQHNEDPFYIQKRKEVIDKQKDAIQQLYIRNQVAALGQSPDAKLAEQVAEIAKDATKELQDLNKQQLEIDAAFLALDGIAIRGACKYASAHAIMEARTLGLSPRLQAIIAASTAEAYSKKIGALDIELGRPNSVPSEVSIQVAKIANAAAKKAEALARGRNYAPGSPEYEGAIQAGVDAAVSKFLDDLTTNLNRNQANILASVNAAHQPGPLPANALFDAIDAHVKREAQLPAHKTTAASTVENDPIVARSIPKPVAPGPEVLQPVPNPPAPLAGPAAQILDTFSPPFPPGFNPKADSALLARLNAASAELAGFDDALAQEMEEELENLKASTRGAKIGRDSGWKLGNVAGTTSIPPRSAYIEETFGDRNQYTFTYQIGNKGKPTTVRVVDPASTENPGSWFHAFSQLVTEKGGILDGGITKALEACWANPGLLREKVEERAIAQAEQHVRRFISLPENANEDTFSMTKTDDHTQGPIYLRALWDQRKKAIALGAKPLNIKFEVTDDILKDLALQDPAARIKFDADLLAYNKEVAADIAKEAALHAAVNGPGYVAPANRAQEVINAAAAAELIRQRTVDDAFAAELKIHDDAIKAILQTPPPPPVGSGIQVNTPAYVNFLNGEIDKENAKFQRIKQYTTLLLANQPTPGGADPAEISRATNLVAKMRGAETTRAAAVATAARGIGYPSDGLEIRNATATANANLGSQADKAVAKAVLYEELCKADIQRDLDLSIEIKKAQDTYADATRAPADLAYQTELKSIENEYKKGVNEWIATYDQQRSEKIANFKETKAYQAAQEPERSEMLAKEIVAAQQEFEAKLDALRRDVADPWLQAELKTIDTKFDAAVQTELKKGVLEPKRLADLDAALAASQSTYMTAVNAAKAKAKGAHVDDAHIKATSDLAQADAQRKGQATLATAKGNPPLPSPPPSAVSRIPMDAFEAQEREKARKKGQEATRQALVALRIEASEARRLKVDEKIKVAKDQYKAEVSDGDAVQKAIRDLKATLTNLKSVHATKVAELKSTALSAQTALLKLKAEDGVSDAEHEVKVAAETLKIESDLQDGLEKAREDFSQASIDAIDQLQLDIEKATADARQREENAIRIAAGSAETEYQLILEKIPIMAEEKYGAPYHLQQEVKKSTAQMEAANVSRYPIAGEGQADFIARAKDPDINSILGTALEKSREELDSAQAVARTADAELAAQEERVKKATVQNALAQANAEYAQTILQESKALDGATSTAETLHSNLKQAVEALAEEMKAEPMSPQELTSAKEKLAAAKAALTALSGELPKYQKVLQNFNEKMSGALSTFDSRFAGLAESKAVAVTRDNYSKLHDQIMMTKLDELANMTEWMSAQNAIIEANAAMIAEAEVAAETLEKERIEQALKDFTQAETDALGTFDRMYNIAGNAYNALDTAAKALGEEKKAEPMSAPDKLATDKKDHESALILLSAAEVALKAHKTAVENFAGQMSDALSDFDSTLEDMPQTESVTKVINDTHESCDEEIRQKREELTNVDEFIKSRKEQIEANATRIARDEAALAQSAKEQEERNRKAAEEAERERKAADKAQQKLEFDLLRRLQSEDKKLTHQHAEARKKLDLAISNHSKAIDQVSALKEQKDPLPAMVEYKSALEQYRAAFNEYKGNMQTAIGKAELEMNIKPNERPADASALAAFATDREDILRPYQHDLNQIDQRINDITTEIDEISQQVSEAQAQQARAKEQESKGPGSPGKSDTRERKQRAPSNGVISKNKLEKGRTYTDLRESLANRPSLDLNKVGKPGYVPSRSIGDSIADHHQQVDGQESPPHSPTHSEPASPHGEQPALDLNDPTLRAVEEDAEKVIQQEVSQLPSMGTPTPTASSHMIGVRGSERKASPQVAHPTADTQPTVEEPKSPKRTLGGSGD